MFKESTKQKGFAPILIILVIAVIAAGAYFLGTKNILKLPTFPLSPSLSPSPTTDPTANWKILNNTAYSYSLKYPVTLRAFGVGINVDETTADTVIISSNPEAAKITSPTMYIIAAERKYTVYKDMSLEDIVQADFDANKANQNISTRMIGAIENVIFAGKPAFTFQMESSGFSGKWHGFVGYTGINKVLEFDHNGTHFTIVYTSDPVFDQILSTFKFAD